VPNHASRAASAVARRIDVSPTAGCVVLDLVFVTLSILFFVVSIGYVAACDRLMP
jgi:hypothetical protein